MAERRMFSKKVIDSDSFMEMPSSSQCLYFHLAMRADDDGFINNPKSIMRIIGASEDDLKLLMVKRFILSFESGVIVIKHWRLHNLIRKDRYVETNYIDEKKTLFLDDKGIYHEINYEWQPNDNQMTTSCQPEISLDVPQYRLGKDSIVEDSIGKDSIVEDTKKNESRARENFPPTLDDVKNYFYFEMDNEIEYYEPYNFFNYNASKNWSCGENWKPLADMWHRNAKLKRGEEDE